MYIFAVFWTDDNHDFDFVSVDYVRASSAPEAEARWRSRKFSSIRGTEVIRVSQV